jgi:hypothetical protein
MRLAANHGLAYQGSIILGLGFTLSEEKAHALIVEDAKNGDVLYPYLNGQDLNSHPMQKARRWVINFWDWPLSRDADGNWQEAGEEEQAEWVREGRVPKDFPGSVAEDFPQLLSIVREKVKPDRDKNKRKARRERWWQFAENASGLYHAIGRGDSFFAHPAWWEEAPLPRHPQVLAITGVSKFLVVTFVENDAVFTQDLRVLSLASMSDFGLLQSCVHTEWAWKQSSRLETRLRYTPSDILETFPFPLDYGCVSISEPAASFHESRRAFMQDEAVGLTKFNNRFHDPEDQDSRLESLRDLQRAIDLAVCEAYGWADVDLGHGFHEIDYLPENENVRFAISRAARLEILRRLSTLNRERYDEEVRQGMHDKRSAGSKKGRAKRTKSKSNAGKKLGTGQGALDF